VHEIVVVAFDKAKRLGIAAMSSRKAGSLYGGRAGWLEIPCAVSARR